MLHGIQSASALPSGSRRGGPSSSSPISASVSSPPLSSPVPSSSPDTTGDTLSTIAPVRSPAARCPRSGGVSLRKQGETGERRRACFWGQFSTASAPGGSVARARRLRFGAGLAPSVSPWTGFARDRGVDFARAGVFSCDLELATAPSGVSDCPLHRKPARKSHPCLTTGTQN